MAAPGHRGRWRSWITFPVFFQRAELAADIGRVDLPSQQEPRLKDGFLPHNAQQLSKLHAVKIPYMAT